MSKINIKIIDDNGVVLDQVNTNYPNGALDALLQAVDFYLPYQASNVANPEFNVDEPDTETNRQYLNQSSVRRLCVLFRKYSKELIETNEAQLATLEALNTVKNTINQFDNNTVVT